MGVPGLCKIGYRVFPPYALLRALTYEPNGKCRKALRALKSIYKLSRETWRGIARLRARPENYRQTTFRFAPRLRFSVLFRLARPGLFLFRRAKRREEEREEEGKARTLGAIGALATRAMQSTTCPATLSSEINHPPPSGAFEKKRTPTASSRTPGLNKKGKGKLERC